jgi:AcrR family transcriptional regulator
VQSRSGSPRPAADLDPPRTRGGWIPVGTAAERRTAQVERGNERGTRRRREIIEAARRVFERDGYTKVGVADIVREAGVAHGSFYTYFTSKYDVFRVVADDVAAKIDREVTERADGESALDPVEALRRANLRYFEAYRENAAIYALLHHVAHAGEDLAMITMARRRRHTERIAELIRRWQERGLADPSVDPEPTAAALLSMISNVCFCLFVGHDVEYDLTRAADSVNEAWIRTLDLRRRPNRRWLAANAERMSRAD